MTLAYLLGSIALHLQNTLIVLAGRNCRSLYESYKTDLGADAILIELPPFDVSEFRNYSNVKQRILSFNLEDEWLEKLFLISGGVPVLVDMAIQWAQTNRNIVWLDELSRDDLHKAVSGDQGDFNDLKLRFQREIVMPIAELQSDFDYLQFLLAKIHPLDLDGIMAMLDLDHERAEIVMGQALQSVTIKRLPGGFIKLHDEVQRLVEAHVWPLRDTSDKKWEQRDSRRLIRYLAVRSEKMLQRILELKKREDESRNDIDPTKSIAIFVEKSGLEASFWAFRTERLRHQIALDAQAGYHLFDVDYYGLARHEVASPSARDGILDAIAPYATLEKPETDINGHSLTMAQRLSIMAEKARELVYGGTYPEADTIYDQLLEYSDKSSEIYVSLLTGKADALFKQGRFRAALDTNERALRLAAQYPTRKIEVAINAGWFNRRMGNLDQAIAYYKMALELAVDHGDDKSVALIFQNQAYVNALQDKERKAMDEVGLAIRMWLKLRRDRGNLDFRLGQAYNVAGEICLEFERPFDALVYFEKSQKIFAREESGQAVWSANSRSGEGFAHWQLAVKARKNSEEWTADNELRIAEEALEWAAKNARAIDFPQILNRLGEVYFLQNRWELTETSWMDSLKAARRIGDAFNELHSLSDLVRLSFFHPIEGFLTRSDFEREYRDCRRRYQTHFSVLEGLFRTYLGHLAMKDHAIDEAVNLYKDGLFILSEHGTYAPFNLEDQLDFIEKEIIPGLSLSMVQDLSDALKKAWIKDGYDVTVLGYVRERLFVAPELSEFDGGGL